MTLRQKTISGLLWSFVDSIAGSGITFIVGIVLARLLSPKEFGLVGMLAIFIAISQSLIDSGFRQALIRKQDCRQADYSTVFYFNIAVGAFCYLLLVIGAPAISTFFAEPILRDLIRVLGLGVIFNSFAIIQGTLLIKHLDFRLQANISVIASVASGIVSIGMALGGWGVWSLVALTVLRGIINSTLLWLWSTWKPTLCFDPRSFSELFGFGGRLLLSGLIDTIYRNIYYLVIGKYFTAMELGYYTEADQFVSVPSANLQGVIGRVSYPALATMQGDIPRLREAYRRIIKSSMLVTFVLMLGMAAVARPMILSVLGAKWEPSVIYLQMLCFVGMFYPLHALNLNMLQVQGRSDLFLRLEIIKKVLAVPIVVLGVGWGIRPMIGGMIVVTLIAYYLNSFWSGRLIGYSSHEQLADILPSFLLALVASTIMYAEALLIRASPESVFLIQVMTGACLVFSICETLPLRDYLYIKNVIKEQLEVSTNERS